MWQRFSEDSRKAVFYAQEESQRFGEGYVSTEHLLLGLLREVDNPACRVLLNLGFSLSKIRSEIEKVLPHGGAKPTQDMTLTPRGKRCIDLAYQAARDLEDPHIGTEHLLLGLVREGDGLAGRVLAKLGVELEPLRREIQRLRAGGEDRDISERVQSQTANEAREAVILRSQVWQSFLSLPPDPGRLSDLLILLAISDAGGIIRLVLQRCGVAPSSVTTMLYERAFSSQTDDPSPGLSLGQLFTLASEEAAALRSPNVMPHHLMLGLLVDGKSLFAAELANAGVTADAVRQAIADLEKPA